LESLCPDHAISDANNYQFNPFDITKVWSLKDYPKQDIGEIDSNRNPEVIL